ncbi:MAG TPA: MFS transporter [Thermoplasmata archaeon]|nr:MFS transporter [Thermoplasmata archaeon]
MTEPAPVDALPADEKPILTRRQSAGILAALLMGLLLGALDNFIVVTALPTISAQLHDLNGFVFVVTSYLIAQTVAIPVFGKLSDQYGRRSFYLFGLVIFLAGSALSGFSQNMGELIAFRAIQGLGSGAFFTVVFSIIADIFPPKAAARLAGILSSVFGVAIVFGPLIGSYIIDTTTWRWIFFVNLPVGFTAIALVLTSMRETRAPVKARPFDAVGAGLLATWVGTLIYALVEVSHGWAWTDPRTLALLGVALVVLPIFLWQEWRAHDPLVPIRYFRSRLIAAASGVNFLRGAVLIVVATFIPQLVQSGLGGSTDTSRDVLYAVMVPMIFGAALGGMLTGRLGYRTPTAVGMVVAAIGVFLLTTVPTNPPIFRFVSVILPVGLTGALIPVGFGIGLTFAPTQLAVQYSVAKTDVGSGTSLVWFINNLGGSIVGSVLGAYQLSILTGSRLPLASAWALSIQDVWWGLLPVAAAGIFFAVVMAGRLPSLAEAETGTTPAAPAMG